MGYDKTKPCDINNPLPQSRWPFRKGRRVLFLTKDNEILQGVVRFYQPALEGSCVVTKGSPCVNIHADRKSHVVSVDDVRNVTRSGRRELSLRICLRLEENLKYHERMARDARRLLDLAKALVPAPRRDEIR